MKKIKSIQHLQAEKKRIRLEQKEIESRIRVNWQEVKENLHPANLAKDAFSSMFNKKTTSKERDGGWLHTLIELGLAFVAGKFGEKATEKLSWFFRDKQSSE